jgi:G3E family GTPase
VGSCTDLVATVTYPLRRIYGERFRIAPLSVLVDPVRAEQVFGLAPARKFSDKVLYIWRKQVEEADLLVITKTDLLDAARLTRLQNRLGEEFPGKPIRAVSVRTGAGIDAWFDHLLANDQVPRPVMAPRSNSGARPLSTPTCCSGRWPKTCANAWPAPRLPISK